MKNNKKQQELILATEPIPHVKPNPGSQDSTSSVTRLRQIGIRVPKSWQEPDAARRDRERVGDDSDKES